MEIQIKKKDMINCIRKSKLNEKKARKKGNRKEGSIKRNI